MTDENNMKYIKFKNNPLKVNIRAIQDWESFEEIVKFVLNHYPVKVLTEIDSFDYRKRTFQYENQIFNLIHDDMFGNSFEASNFESEPIVYEICKDLESRLYKE